MDRMNKFVDWVRGGFVNYEKSVEQGLQTRLPTVTDLAQPSEGGRTFKCEFVAADATDEKLNPKNWEVSFNPFSTDQYLRVQSISSETGNIPYFTQGFTVFQPGPQEEGFSNPSASRPWEWRSADEQGNRLEMVAQGEGNNIRLLVLHSEQISTMTGTEGVPTISTQLIGGSVCIVKQEAAAPVK